MSIKTFLQVWGIVSKDEPERYSHEWQQENDAMNDAIVQNFGHEEKSNPVYPDSYWRNVQSRVESIQDDWKRHDAYESLLSAIANNHPRGSGAPIYDEINDAANRNSVR